MTQYNTLNLKLSNSQLNKLKSAIKDGTNVTLSLSSNVAGDFSHKNNFRRKLLLTKPKFQGFVKLLQIIFELI